MSGTHENVPPVQRAIDALLALDAGDVFAPDATAWHNFDELDQPALPNAIDGTKWVIGIMPDFHFEDIEAYRISEELSVAKYAICGTLPDGSSMHCPVVLFAHAQDGKVTRLEEYLDTAQSVNLFQKFASA